MGVFAAEVLELRQCAWNDRSEPINPIKAERADNLKQSSVQLDAFADKDNRAVLSDEETERRWQRVEFQGRPGTDLVVVSESAGPVEADPQFRGQLRLQAQLLLTLLIIYTLIVTIMQYL
jgi:hypothetical protein